MGKLLRWLLVGALPAIGVSVATAVSVPKAGEVHVAAASWRDASAWSDRIAQETGRGRVRLLRQRPDDEYPERTIRRHGQVVDGVPVWGTELVQHVDASGATRAVFGRLADDLEVDLRPRLRAEQAETIAMGLSGPGFYTATPAELVVVPRIEQLGNARVHLAYQLWTLSDVERRSFLIDAHDGSVVLDADDSQTEAAVGIGTGGRGARRKISVERVSASEYRTSDGLRPPAIRTYDVNFDPAVLSRLGSTGQIDPRFLARDADNEWTDRAVVDGHAYLGWTYDYYYKRHGRRGIDNADMRVIALIHAIPNYVNASWNRITTAMTFGDGVPSRGPYTQSLEVVAHEFTHGVTQFTWGALALPQAAALNESFSDIMGTAVEWYYQPSGEGYDRADYWQGEDLGNGPFSGQANSTRAPWNPSVLCRTSATLGFYCNPDHFSKYRPEVDIHYNGDISNHAYYLLIEGGTNRTSGVRVNGVGRASREKAEKIFYRGYTAYLTPTATFLDARRATIQAARDLYGPSSAETAETALAWTAVGVVEP